MSGIYEQRNPFSFSDPDKFKVSQTYPDKQPSKDIKFKNLRFKSEIIQSLYIRQLLETKTKELLDKKKEEKSTIAIDLQTTLKKLKHLFGKLAIENCSQDYRFADELSKYWHAMLYKKERGERSSMEQYMGSLNLFIKKIEEYPNKTDYSLGYYLTKYTGEKWIPFPFMDILSALHENAILKKNRSILHDWIQTLSYILNKIN